MSKEWSTKYGSNFRALNGCRYSFLLPGCGGGGPQFRAALICRCCNARCVKSILPSRQAIYFHTLLVEEKEECPGEPLAGEPLADRSWEEAEDRWANFFFSFQFHFLSEVVFLSVRPFFLPEAEGKLQARREDRVSGQVWTVTRGERGGKPSRYILPLSVRSNWPSDFEAY